VFLDQDCGDDGQVFPLLLLLLPPSAQLSICINKRTGEEKNTNSVSIKGQRWSNNSCQVTFTFFIVHTHHSSYILHT
jgi:hypothetical protein